MTPVANISSRISSSASLAEIGGSLGDCLIGRAEPVSISRFMIGQIPNQLMAWQKSPCGHTKLV